MQRSDVHDLAGASVAFPRLSRAALVEATEKTLVLLFFSYFSVNMGSHVDHDRLANLILLLSEALPVLLVILHRPARRLSTDPGHWLLALSVSFLPVFISPATGASFAPAFVSGSLMIFGFLLSLLAKLCLSRSFGIVPANRGVRRGGPYRLVRHPIYAGYIVTQAGFLAACPAVWNILTCGLIWALLVRRIMAEEAILGEDRAYRAYAAEVRYRLFPGLF